MSLAITKSRSTALKLAGWLEANVHEGLAVFALPRSHRRRLRTSNQPGRLNEELKRRTRVAGMFPNDASLLRMVSAVLMEFSEDWETNRKHLALGPNRPVSLCTEKVQKRCCTIRGTQPCRIFRLAC